MQNLGVLLRLVRRITPQLDMQGGGEEIRYAVVEELDYELEAANQRTLARILPRPPVHRASRTWSPTSRRERVIVTEFVEGDGLRGAARRSPRRSATASARSSSASTSAAIYRYRRFSGDPHPGNLIRLADGRVAFLDFGLFKRMDREPQSSSSWPASGGGARATTPELHRLLAECGLHPRPRAASTRASLRRQAATRRRRVVRLAAADRTRARTARGRARRRAPGRRCGRRRCSTATSSSG